MGDEVNNFKTIGIWMSEKKFQKLKWPDFYNTFRNHGYNLVKLDLNRPLEEQGDIKVFIHKLTDLIVAADQGDAEAHKVIANVEQYISNRPDMLVMDSLPSVRMLLDRNVYYSLLTNNAQLNKNRISFPPFCVIRPPGLLADGVCQLKESDVLFPVVCKPLVGHGSKAAHSMCLVFNAGGLARCRPPYIAQSFINHNAILYKIFVIGNRYHVVERPSLKNFTECDEAESIYFESGDVCNSDSRSTLSVLDPQDRGREQQAELDLRRVEVALQVLRRELRLMLFGVDIVIDNLTNVYAIIDINVYPGYEGFPNFFENLVGSIDDMLNPRDEHTLTIESASRNIHSPYKCGRNTFINVGNQR